MKICEEKLCSGCGLCAELCPHNAIEMTSDAEGFLRPCIDEKKCVECGVCQKKCPVNCKSPNPPSAVYAAYSKDKEIRRLSSSGGVFYWIAEAVISSGGAVIGAGFDDNLQVVHKCAESREELFELMGSKYVQSNICDSYKTIAGYLSAGKTVLFSGTPCQCAAIRNAFGSKEGLILADFICHGTPTPVIWDKFIKEEFPEAVSVSFRDKKRGWEEFSLRIEGKEGVYNQSRYKDPYLRLFLRNVTLRPSCYSCSWKAEGFASDITFADFWGVSTCLPHMNDDKGVSLVIVRSEKGSTLFERAALNLNCEKVELESAVRGNGMYKESTPLPKDRSEFFEMISRGASFKEITDHFARPLNGGVIAKIRFRTKVKKALGTVCRLKQKIKRGTL